MTSSILSERLHQPGNPFLGRGGSRDIIAGFELSDDFFTNLIEAFVLLGAVVGGILVFLVAAAFAMAATYSGSK